MKICKFIFICFFSFICINFNALAANGEQEKKGIWFFSAPWVLLPPIEGFEKNMFLFSGDDNSVVLLSFYNNGEDDTGYCKAGETREFGDISPLSINGEFYKFFVVCLNGNSLIIPKSDIGKENLTNIVMSKKPLTVSIGDGVVFHYPPSNVTEMLAKKNAMKNAK